MEAVVSAIITPVVASLLVPIKRHLGFLFSSAKYDRGMREKIKALNFAANDMKRRKDANDVKNLMVPDRVPSWLEEAQVIIDNESDSISADGNGCLHLKRRYKAGKHCFKVTEDIKHLMEEKGNMEWTNEQKPLGRVDSATPQVPQDVTQNIFGSRKEIFQRALQLLEADDTTQMVALCGMGGIGKTTMMEELKKDVKNRELFHWVVKVVIGNRTDPIAVQEAIAQYTGANLSETTKEARAERLEKTFLEMSQNGKKKILIILDDLWNMVDLKDIGLGSPLPKGFKLFLTSRYFDINHLEDILMHPSDQYSFCNLKSLYFEECANLKYLFTVNVASTLTNLETLTVSNCRVLGSLIHGENNGAEGIKFNKLKLLELKYLPRFEGLCDNINIVMELPQLVELELLSLPNITCIFDSSNNISATTIPLLNNEVVCPKLEELKIRGMKKLKEIWACEEEYDRTPVLKEIEVGQCDEIQNLFPNNPMRLLSHLEKLTVKNCGSIQALIDIDSECVGQVKSSLKNLEIKKCKKFRNIVTPTTIKFDMGALTDIIIDFSEEPNDWSEESDEENEVSEVDDSRVAVLFSSVHTLHHISSIELRRFKQVEVIFDIEIPYVGIVAPNDDEQPLLLPCLTEMMLIRMKSMTHLWKCNWSKFLMLHNYQQKSSFQNLTTIYMYKCETIEYLFSPLMATLLSNLKKVDIHDCERIQEVVSNRDDEDEESTTSTSTSTTINLFPRFDCLTLENLENLERIGGGIPKGTTDHAGNDNFTFSVPWSLGQYSREIKICRCHALSTVIPSYAAEQLRKIEVLKIYNCSSLMEVFETKELKNSPIFGQGSGGSWDDTTPAAIPKCITTHKMPNLKILNIFRCPRLVDIFTFSTLGSLGLLQKLSIQDCEELKVIVREEHGEQTTTTSKAVIFPCLKSIILASLPNLKGFFFGMNEFQLPLLDEVIINICPQMMVFTPLPLRAPKFKYIRINAGKYCTPECCSFFTTATLPQTSSQSSDNTSSLTTISEEFLSYSHSLIEMNLENERERQVIFSYDELPQLQNLEKLHAFQCESVPEVFDVGTGVGCSNSSQTVLQLPKLRDVHLQLLKSLKYIWKSNGRTILEFPNLTKLYISKCPQLEHVFTSSMVGSLLQLKELSVSSCPDMEVIVKEDQEEEEGGDGKVNEIRLPCLESLHLEGLDSLKGFCLENVDYSLPSLESMGIYRCKSLTIFTKGGLFVPELKFIETSLGDINLEEEQDVNSFIITKRQEITGVESQDNIENSSSN